MRMQTSVFFFFSLFFFCQKKDKIQKRTKPQRKLGSLRVVSRLNKLLSQRLSDTFSNMTLVLKGKIHHIASFSCCCSVVQPCLTLCNLMNCSISNSCPLSQWCHPIISCSVTSFSSCPQPFPASGSFQWVGSSQSIGASASSSVLPMNIQGWFPLGLTSWSPCSPRDSQEFPPAPQFESINALALSLLYGPTLISVQSSTQICGLWAIYSSKTNPQP